MSSAHIYAVGVGPGDPELLTRKAERILRSVPVIMAPTAVAGDASYALSIIEPFIDRGRQQVLERVFPMRKSGDPELEGFWEDAAAETVSLVQQGQDVAFITIGDPFLYSTFLYLYRIIRERHPEIPVEIVPGITSISAAAAAAGVPLGLASDRIAILPATYEDEELRRAFTDFDTVVLMKVSRVFDHIHSLLKEMGLEQSAVFVRRVGSGDEEVVHDLSTLLGKKLDYLSLLIVKR